MIVGSEIVDTVLFCTPIFYFSSAADTVLDNEVTGLQFVTGNLANVIFDSIAWSRPGHLGNLENQAARDAGDDLCHRHQLLSCDQDEQWF